MPDPSKLQTCANNSFVSKGETFETIFLRDKGQHSNTFTQDLTFQNLGSPVYHMVTSTVNQSLSSSSNLSPPPIMATRFAPFVLPAP